MVWSRCVVPTVDHIATVVHHLETPDAGQAAVLTAHAPRRFGGVADAVHKPAGVGDHPVGFKGAEVCGEKVLPVLHAQRDCAEETAWHGVLVRGTSGASERGYVFTLVDTEVVEEVDASSVPPVANVVFHRGHDEVLAGVTAWKPRRVFAKIKRRRGKRADVRLDRAGGR